jgi:diaminohydroxyphosphoribosylaminopyrimidine deaminase/5-amino-6-(5-phosphoribosylamino)uracil reductase
MKTTMKHPDEYYLARALKLARRGEGGVSPNPMVGCVIVKGGRIIGEGYHRRFGGPHAEIEALRRATKPVRGATLYVTLEPCCHHGKTPPCTESIIAAGIARVVVGTADPNPLVSGKGMTRLRRHGIPTAVGVRTAECARLNERFFTFMKTGVPFLTLKFAQTLDAPHPTLCRHPEGSGHRQNNHRRDLAGRRRKARPAGKNGH